MPYMQRNSRGFSLAEVLMALGLAAIVIGVVLQSASRDAISVSRAPKDYQALLRASQVLEYRMEEDRKNDDATGSVGEKFPYDLSVKPVVTDARVEEVVVTVASASRKRETVSAYRLKVRRESKADPNATPSPGGTTTGTGGTTTGTGGGTTATSGGTGTTSAAPGTTSGTTGGSSNTGGTTSGGAAPGATTGTTSTQ